LTLNEMTAGHPQPTIKKFKAESIRQLGIGPDIDLIGLRGSV